MPNRQDHRFEYLTYLAIFGVLYYILVYKVNEFQHDHYRYPSFNGNNAAVFRIIDNASLHVGAKIQYYKINATATIHRGMKYILEWIPEGVPVHLLQHKQDCFIDNRCKYTNCYITYDRDYLKNHKDYDAILFNGCSLRDLRYRSDLPQNRSSRQKYVFATLEPSTICPVTNPLYDNFFNWTWTTRQTSDILWNYLAVFDKMGNKIGPNKEIKWIKHYTPIGEELKKKLSRKSKGAAWFVSHCSTPGRRENFVALFQKEFNRYGWALDIYGACSYMKCGTSWCYKMLQRDYFFYFAFENSIVEDYVTEKLLTPLKNLAVPVVYGGANYSRYLPPGSYLDARKLGPKALAKVMNDAIRNLSIYYDFFKWMNHYYYESSEKADLCNICTALNTKATKTTTHKIFRIWWNGLLKQTTYDVILKNFLMNENLLNLASGYNYTRKASLVLVKNITNQSSVQQSLISDLVYNNASSMQASGNIYRNVIREINNSDASDIEIKNLTNQNWP